MQMGVGEERRNQGENIWGKCDEGEIICLPTGPYRSLFVLYYFQLICIFKWLTDLGLRKKIKIFYTNSTTMCHQKHRLYAML